MTSATIEDFLATDRSGVFAFEIQMREVRPSVHFLEQLKQVLPTLDEFHATAALMIAEEWDPDGFAALAAPLLAHEDTGVWCAAHNLLRAVSRLTPSTLREVELYAEKCPKDCSDLLHQLRQRTVGA